MKKVALVGFKKAFSYEEAQLSGIINVDNEVGLTIMKQGDEICLNIGKGFKKVFLKEKKYTKIDNFRIWLFNKKEYAGLQFHLNKNKNKEKEIKYAAYLELIKQIEEFFKVKINKWYGCKK